MIPLEVERVKGRVLVVDDEPVNVELLDALRETARESLADYKVPRKIVFLAEIPKGATGKLMRIGLAEKLGVTA